MGVVSFNRELKMLVLIFLIFTVADFCQSKAFPEEAEKSRGKRYYNHDQNAGYRQTYEPQINAEHWMTGDVYQPQIDGQPIYVPAVDQSGSYNEFLDAYYKAYTPAWNLETLAQSTHRTKSIYRNPEVSNGLGKSTSDAKHISNYGLPTSKESELKLEKSPSEYDELESEDYDVPRVIDRIVTELSNENSHLLTTELKDLNEFEEPVIRESLKKAEPPKSKPIAHDKYDKPVIVKTVKQKPKTNNAKKTSTKPSISKIKPQLEDSEEYEKPVVYNNVRIKPSKKPLTSTSNYDDRTSQATRKKTKGKRRKQTSKSSKPRIGEQAPSVLDPKIVDEISEKLSKEVDQSVEQDQLYDKPSKEEEKVIVKTNPKTKPVKTKEKVVITDSEYDLVEMTEKATAIPDSKDKPVRKNEKIVVKTNPKTKPVKVDSKHEPVKTKGTTKTESKDKSVKVKNKVVVKTGPQYQPVKTEGKEHVKPDHPGKPVKENVSVKYSVDELEKEIVSRKQLNDNDYSAENEMSNKDDPLEDESDFGDVDVTESLFPEEKLNSNKPIGNGPNLESSKPNAVEKSNLNFPNANDFRGLSSMNSNIWSMLFNPNAEQNRLKQKRCITRSNETGYCTYIQNCEVPQIATSLEQLLNNACVIDDIFIGVCCPEFPVETVKVHWDHTISDFDNQIEDEFGHNSEDCGMRSNEAVELQSWPWKAPLVSMSNGKIFCGGVLVSEDHVLTAAHCTTKIPKNQILVRLGQYDDSSGDDYAVVEIKRHAQYNSRTMQNDVALLKLGRRVMNDAHIGIVCLPDEDHKNDHNGETATLLGWRGIFGTKSRDPEFLEVLSNKECENRLGMKVPSTLLCTDTRRESERTCNADSGAPLVIEDDGKYEVIGILAWNRNDCNQRFPSTFSRVSSYTGWIKNHLA